jgi:5-(carboxyamino)imidazole ribonucleotide synthase
MTNRQVGVIGGGQLAWMMAQEAPRLNLDLIVQTPHPDDPAIALAQDVILAAIDDAQATSQLAQRCEVITFENEFVNLAALQGLEKQGVVFRPSLTALAPLLDKYQQRTYLKNLGLPVPAFWNYDATQPLPLDYPFVLKARRHGYDGQGTSVVRNAEALGAIAAKIPTTGWMIEAFVPFARELAVIAARNKLGEIVIYPIVETYQEDHVCRWVKAPAVITTALQQEIEHYVQLLLTDLQVIGLFGIEFFLTAADQLLINEVAPRTHNSGHYSLDACETSQFAMQLQAIMDLPLGSPRLKCQEALMVNLLGYEVAQRDYALERAKLAALPQTYVHWYQKQESRPGRKLGHVTVLGDGDRASSSQQSAAMIEQINRIWYPTHDVS